MGNSAAPRSYCHILVRDEKPAPGTYVMIPSERSGWTVFDSLFRDRQSYAMRTRYAKARFMNHDSTAGALIVENDGRHWYTEIPSMSLQKPRAELDPAQHNNIV